MEQTKKVKHLELNVDGVNVIERLSRKGLESKAKDNLYKVHHFYNPFMGIVGKCQSFENEMWLDVYDKRVSVESRIITRNIAYTQMSNTTYYIISEGLYNKVVSSKSFETLSPYTNFMESELYELIHEVKRFRAIDDFDREWVVRNEGEKNGNVYLSDIVGLKCITDKSYRRLMGSNVPFDYSRFVINGKLDANIVAYGNNPDEGLKTTHTFIYYDHHEKGLFCCREVREAKIKDILCIADDSVMGGRAIDVLSFLADEGVVFQTKGDSLSYTLWESRCCSQVWQLADIELFND